MTTYLFIVEKRHFSVRTIVIMQYYMVVRATGAEDAKGFRLIVLPANKDASGVGLQLDAVRQIS